MNNGSNKKIKCSEYYKREYVLRKLRAIEYLGGKCVKCDYDKYYGALEFHHRDPSQKEMVWNRLRCFPWERQKIELDKCELLCANCHREAHIDIEVLEKALEWKKHCDEYNERRVIKDANCQWCGKLFKPRSNHNNKFCKLKCFKESREIIKWPDDLPELVKQSSKRAIAKQLGVSDKAVAKRLKNHHSILTI